MHFVGFLMVVSCLSAACRAQLFPSRSLRDNSACSSGQQQSPINIDSSHVFSECGASKFMIYSPSKPVESRLSMHSNTLRITTPLFFSMVESITMEGEPGVYISREVILHLKSEHTIHHRAASAELQIVHKLDGAGPDWYTNLIVAVLLNETSDDHPGTTLLDDMDFHHPQAFLLSLADTIISQIQKTGFFHYRGSFSTQPCDETVLWYVSDQILPIRHKHLSVLKSMSVGREKSRQVQPLNSRHVYYVNGTCNQNVFLDGVGNWGRRIGWAVWALIGLCLVYF